jgi:hypothetical protein
MVGISMTRLSCDKECFLEKCCQGLCLTNLAWLSNIAASISGCSLDQLKREDSKDSQRLKKYSLGNSINKNLI